MFSWSWFSFFIGNLSGAAILFLILGAMQIGARNDEIQPSVEKKPEKRKNVH